MENEKQTATAANGTILEVGKKYTTISWARNQYIKILAIEFFGEKFMKCLLGVNN